MTDTIVAISTPAGVGGVALLRISGPQAVSVAQSLMPGLSLRPRHAHYAQVLSSGQPLDQVVATLFQGPHSYTGEDVVEITCHGSLYVQQQLLLLAQSFGARLAQPGEFTLRAFLNGRLDLAQSEAVADLIHSTTEAQHRLAVSQLRGGFSSDLALIRSRMVELTSLLELELDFSDEEVEFADRSRLLDLIAELETKIGRLVASFSLGNAVRQGVPVAIVGRPNVGKSTLLNALLNDDRAIVSDLPGTTRDTIEDTLVLSGILFRLIDTAGIRHSSDAIESVGIERSFAAAAKAQIVILLTDSDASSDLDLLTSRVDLSDKTLLHVRNKADLAAAAEPSHIAISALTGQGLDLLRQQLVQAVGFNPSETVLTNARHHEAMTHVLSALRQVRQGLLQQLPADLVVIDLREALYHLGTITGQVTSDEVLGSIFSRFCIGK